MITQTTVPNVRMDVQFNADLFADRKKERALFLETVHAATQHTYLEFNGVAGQGKSELLKWICHNAQQEGYLAAYVDFELQDYYRPEIHPILAAIADHLSAQTASERFLPFQQHFSAYFKELQRVYRASYESESSESVDRRPLKTLEDLLLQAFHDILNTLLKTHKIVFCLDSTEKVYRPALRTFEEQVLTPYVNHPNFMLVTAGQEELVWKTSKIRNLIKRYDLAPFDFESVHDQINRLAAQKGFRIEDDEQILQNMLTLTLGHPFSTYKLADFWTQGFTTSLTQERVDAQFMRSIRELLDKVIAERILGKFQLSDAYPPVAKILWHLAPLRHVELSTFRYVLSTCLEERFKAKSFLFYERLIGEFQSCYIFTQWHLGTGFTIEPVVRNVLLWDMRVNKHEYFVSIHKLLAEQYDRWVAHTRDATQIKNLVERLYHSAMYLRETEPQVVQARVQEALRQYVAAYCTVEYTGSQEALHDQTNRLQNTLETDSELAELVDMKGLLEIIRKDF